jgi:hypothetical protein
VFTIRKLLLDLHSSDHAKPEIPMIVSCSITYQWLLVCQQHVPSSWVLCTRSYFFCYVTVLQCLSGTITMSKFNSVVSLCGMNSETLWTVHDTPTLDHVIISVGPFRHSVRLFSDHLMSLSSACCIDINSIGLVWWWFGLCMYMLVSLYQYICVWKSCSMLSWKNLLRM